MGVADAGAKEQIEDTREHWVTDVSVQPRHRPGMDVAHAVAHHELGACVKPPDEPRDVVEVIGEVGVGHHDIVAGGRRKSGHVGAAVAPPPLVNDPCASGLGELSAAVIGVVVDDDHLAGKATGVERGDRGADALLDVFLLIQTRDDDRHRWGRACGLDDRGG